MLSCPGYSRHGNCQASAVPSVRIAAPAQVRVLSIPPMGRLWRESTVAVGPLVTTRYPTRYELQRHVPRPTTAGAHPMPRPLHPRASRRAADPALPATRTAPPRMPRERPPRISPRDSIRRSTTNMSRHAGANVSRAAISRNTTPQRCRSWRAKRSTYSAARRRHGAAAPIGRTRAGTRGPAPALAAAPVGSISARKILEAIGRDQARGHKLPQCIFHFAGEAAGMAREFVEEGRAARLKRGKHFARRMG